jgi:lipoate-protein ligase A
MVYVNIPENKNRLLTFYLAAEEYVANNFDRKDYFFMWQVNPTVIFGRNQLIENEVNLEYCKNHDIKTFRRKSGGGCVYADMNNIMLSYITDEGNVNFTFNKYINLIVFMLNKLGVNAVASGRNDIMIDGRKVSGNAFYHTPKRNIVHGTMLYDTDMQNMVGSITPSDTKLISKGIQSVRQHITLLKDYIDLSLEEFKAFMKQQLCDEEITLTEEDIEQIKIIEQEYLSKEFIYGNNPKYNIISKQRINDVGDMEIRIEIKNNIIKSINVMGDFFIAGDIDAKIIKPLRNIPLERNRISEALPDSLSEIIPNLKKDDFINLILQSKESNLNS